MDQSKNMFDNEFTRMFSAYKTPGVDYEAALAVMKKNLDTMQKANGLAVKAFQDAAKVQTEFMRNSFNSLTSVFQDLSQEQSVEGQISKQKAIAKENFEKSIDNFNEISNIVSKANADSFKVVTSRINENIDELSDLAAKENQAA